MSGYKKWISPPVGPYGPKPDFKKESERMTDIDETIKRVRKRVEIADTLNEDDLLIECADNLADEVERLRESLKESQSMTCDVIENRVVIINQRDRLAEALQHLYDYQNGSPLPKYENEWNEAMKKTEAALKELENEPTETETTLDRDTATP